VNRIRYFTARVRPTPKDPQKSQRQDIYLRALKTLPNLSIHFGRFARHIADKPLAGRATGVLEYVTIIDTKEKGSDVNLATYLLADAFQGDYDAAIVVSNDADLQEPLRVVQRKLGVEVHVLCPQRKEKARAWKLLNAAKSYRAIRKGVLKVSQFPDTLVDKKGSFGKPAVW